METLRLLVQNLIIIAVLTVLMEMLLPDGSMRKYVQTVMGLMVIVAVVQAMSGFSGGSLFKEIDTYAWRSTSQQGSQVDILKQGLQLDANNRQQALAQYKKGIENQMTALVGKQGELKIVKAELQMQDNPEKKDFGKIEQVVLVLGKEQQMKQIQPVIIQIENGTGENSSSVQPPPEYSETATRAIETVANFYNIPQKQVNVQYTQ